MRIVVDLQAAQTESKFRGIGRYSLALAREMAKNRGGHELLIALNGLFPESIEPIRAAFDGILAQDNICVWYVPGPVRECERKNDWRRQAAENIREAYLASLYPDIIHVSSLFEGYAQDAVTSIGVFDHETPVFVTLYDLIPLVYSRQYLNPYPDFAHHYKRKTWALRKARGWLCISESTMREAEVYLGERAGCKVNISSACDDFFKKIHISPTEEERIRQRFNLDRPFLLYTGGGDWRKNLEGFLRAFALLSPELRGSHQIVFAGRMLDRDVKHLERTAKG